MGKKNYFSAIANLRVIAIMAILLNHAQIGIQDDTEYSLAYLAYGQFFKFGSLLFMIISGFLFEKTITKYSTKQLVNRKTSTILVPSLLFMLPWIILQIGILPFVGERTAAVNSSFVYNQLYSIFFRSIYWFPVNLFIILILNSFIKGARNLKILLVPAILITVFYSINIYFNWVPRRHNSAILAFFTFFFTGRLLYMYYPEIRQFLEKKARKVWTRSSFILLFTAFFGLSVFESYQIQTHFPETDPNNILRFSNIAYTMLLLVLLYQIRNSANFSKYFVDKTVFLIYLIHPYFLYPGKYILDKIISASPVHTIGYVPAEFVYASIVFALSVFTARVLLGNSIFNAILSGEVWKNKTDIEEAVSEKV